MRLQTLDDVARYDWVSLGRSFAPVVPSLKALNPSLLALVYMSSSQVDYTPSPQPRDNWDLKQIPPQWLLTQVGSRLAEAATSSTTSFHVDKVSLVVGGKSYALFVPGDSVVVGDEIVFVQSVDTAKCVITVRRGSVRPATPHAAGERVAATVECPQWGLVELDASTFCPRETVDPAIGPETWVEYRARQVAAALSDPVWDGAFLDGSGPTRSYVLGSSTARTIDPDRSNTLPSDYGAFDAAWADGIRVYHDRVRALVGDGPILIGNCSMTNYDLLNGDTFEGFPNGSGTWYGRPWSPVVFGPQSLGSYFEWMANAREPNLSTILTYGDSGHSASADNYRMIRFGLCTALLNDGFFSYHDDSGLAAWFDEYDNAGRERGYLGQPLGPARRALSELATPNLVPGGGFDTPANLDEWSLLQEGGYAGTVAIDTADKTAGPGSIRIGVTELGDTTDWHLRLRLDPLVSITAGAQYTLSFWAKAEGPRSVGPWVQQAVGAWQDWLSFQNVELTTTWQHFEVSGTAANGGASGRLHFPLGQSVGSVWLDEVKLQRGSTEVWRRDFEGGVALVNASASRVTVPLGEVLRKIKGTQVPSLNDGSLVARVTLPPLDGLVLLRPAASAQGTAAQAAGQLLTEWRHCASLSARARDYYLHVVRHSTAVRRIRAARARLAWQRALVASRAVSVQAAACRASLAGGDIPTARSACEEARTEVAQAWTLVARAWRYGHAGASHATAARRSAASGCEKFYTMRASLVALP